VRKARRITAWGLIVLTSVALGWIFGDALGELTGVQSFEDYTLDLREQTTIETFQDVPSRTRESDIVLVLFDRRSVLDSIDGWNWITPFPRAPLATLVRGIAEAGARTIGVDVFLGEMFPKLNAIDGGNDLLRQAMVDAGNVILVGPVEQTDSGPVAVEPHPFFAEVAAGVGSAELPSSFESYRDGALAVRSGRDLYPSFALSLYAHASGLSVDSILAAARASGRLALPGLPPNVGQVPRDWFDDPNASGSVVPFRIRYMGPPSTVDVSLPGTFQASASSMIEGMIVDLAANSEDPFLGEFYRGALQELFQDKIVILGTGFHAEDRFRTPFFGFDFMPEDSSASGGTYEWMYGVEIHANALQNMLDGEYVRPLGTFGRLLLLIALAAATGGVAFKGGAGWGGGATVLVLAGTWMLAFWAWAGVVAVPGRELFNIGTAGLWVPIGTPSMVATLSYVGSVAYVAIVEGREKRFIKGAFGKYLSPDVVAEISEDPSALALGGEKRPLSLLFSDLRGFTSISEDMDAEDLIALLNEYLNDMTHVVFDEGGYLDKYIGDAIMAFWNAPKEVPDHPDRAMRTAILMQRRMDDLNERWAADDENHQSLQVRIGVHTGEVVVGNVGGEDRFDYSAIGDAVNLAARLEPANKTYDTLNMVSETTLDAGRRDDYRVRELDYITVVGQDAAVKVYELLEFKGVDFDPAKERALRLYAEAMESYRARDWASARTGFEAAVAACPNDGPSILYVKRCQEHLDDPPPPDWDFVVRRTEK
jgi:class 3 adenylate cyclase/CHASE2 domain-containing sensor protein